MCQRIPINNGAVVLVDDQDYALVSNHRWYCKPGKITSYAQTVVKGHCFRMHRLIMAAQPGQQVDHIDGNGLNNTRANLRIVTNSQNSMNRRKIRNASSQYKGVAWFTKAGCWCAYIWVSGRNKHLGKFKYEAAAARAYDAAARQYFGEFARTNF